MDVADFFFAAFMVSLLLALLAILAAVDPTTQTPRFLAGGEPRETILFYGSIYKALPDWLALDTDIDVLHEKLATSFHGDAKELARRAEHKVSRFADSRAFVHVSVVSLTLLGIARIDGLDVHWRSWVVALVLAIVGLLPAWDIGMLMVYGFGGLQRTAWVCWTALFLAPAVLAAGLLIYSAAAVSPTPEFIFVGYALTSILLSRFFLRYLNRRPMAIGSVIVTLIGFAALVLYLLGL
jgi:hypothetical protein